MMSIKKSFVTNVGRAMWVALAGIFASASSVAADPYVVGYGDSIVVTNNFIDGAKMVSIDVDGNIRLSEVGTIPVIGLTLNQVEIAVQDKMLAQGYSGATFVWVEMESYAPIVVTGAVEAAGRFDFLPGMDVGAAVAFAGGVGQSGAEFGNAELMLIGARRRAAAVTDLIVNSGLDVARYEAALAGEDVQMILPQSFENGVRGVAHSQIQALFDAKAADLAETRNKAAILLGSWNSDIRAYETQIEILDQRVVNKEAILGTLTEEMADVERLREQGLTTASRFSSQQQRLFDEREELLNLQTTKITTERALSETARTRDAYLADLRSENLRAAEAARAQYETARQDLSFVIEEIAVLSDDVENGNEYDVVEFLYTIRGARADRLGGASVELDTLLMPGDIVVVEVSPNQF